MFRFVKRTHYNNEVDSSRIFNRNIIDFIKTINGRLSGDNIANAGISVEKIQPTPSIIYHARDTKGPALNDRTSADRQLGGWTRGIEYDLISVSGGIHNINSVQFNTSRESNAIVAWSGECAIRNTGANPFDNAHIDLHLDGQIIDGASWDFVDRIGVYRDPDWRTGYSGPGNAGLYWNRDLVIKAKDNYDEDIQFLLGIKSTIQVGPGFHTLITTLNVNFDNFSSGNGMFRPLDDNKKSSAVDTAVYWNEHEKGYIWTGDAEYKAHCRTMAVYRRTLSIMGFYA